MGDPSEDRDTQEGPIRVEVFGRTDVGLVREHNEDNFLVSDLDKGNRSLLPRVREHDVGPKGSLFAVCDGMGGAAAGEVASQMAVDTIYELMQADDSVKDIKTLALSLEKAILDAGKKIFNSAKEDRSRRGMGTTVTGAALLSERLVLGQVGDSRGYIIREGEIVQVTRDQSLVNQLIEAGQLKPEEAELFEHSNIILQALGTAEDVTVDLTYVDLRRGDILLLCSDGLSGLVPDDRICSIVKKNRKPIDACKALTEAARTGGGHDNITVIVVEFEGEGLKPPKKSDKVEFRRLEVSDKRRPSVLDPPAQAQRYDPGQDYREPAYDDDGGKKARSVGMIIAMVLVLAVGVLVGYLLVESLMGAPQNEPDASVTEPTGPFVTCRFSTNVTGARLIVDDQDFDTIPAGGLALELPPGEHRVVVRQGSEVVAERTIVLSVGDPEQNIELNAPPPEPDAGVEEELDASLDGLATNVSDADKPELEDGGDDGGAAADGAPEAAPAPLPTKAPALRPGQQPPRVRPLGKQPRVMPRPPPKLVPNNPSNNNTGLPPNPFGT